jgi:serine protease Do
MKTSFRHLSPVLGLIMALPALAADSSSSSSSGSSSKSTDAKKESKGRTELRVVATPDEAGNHRFGVRRVGAPAEMESVTFLGIETGPVSATLAAQLALSEGSGLVVSQVGKDTPASGVLQRHDILLKLDDQILIEQRQLSVLVRSHKEGDEVTLTYLRAGKQATAKVKLGKHDIPKFSDVFNSVFPGPAGQGQARNFAYAFNGAGGGGGFEGGQSLPADVLVERDDVNRVLSLIDAGNVPGQRRMSFSRSAGPGDRNISIAVNTGNSQITSDDEQGSLELTIKEGKKELVAKNPKGEQVFSGPVDTPEQRKALPADVRARLEKLEDMKQFSFKTDGDFQGAETRLFRAPAQGISFPRQAAPTPVRRPALFF